MSLELKPGGLISEIELSEKLNLSRTPIREVLMRFALEEKVIKSACEYFPEEKIIELEKNLYAQKILAHIDQK